MAAPLVLIPVVKFPCKTFMPPTVKVPLMCLGHVLSPQFELGQQHINMVGASHIKHLDQGRGFKGNFIGYLSFSYFILITVIACISGRKGF